MLSPPRVPALWKISVFAIDPVINATILPISGKKVKPRIPATRLITAVVLLGISPGVLGGDSLKPG
jgi:hypothetical protein